MKKRQEYCLQLHFSSLNACAKYKSETQKGEITAEGRRAKILLEFFITKKKKKKRNKRRRR